MALEVETGSASPTAESFASVSFCDTYHAKRGNTEWAALTEEEKEIRLRRGTEFIALIGQGRWKGEVVSEDQALPWPRYDVYDEEGVYIPHDSIPIALQRATAEAALRASDDLLPDVESGVIEEEQIKVGPIEERIKYVRGKQQTAVYQKIYALLKGLMTSGLGSVYLERS